MTDYDFITDNIRYSYSSVSNFDNCKYAFKLTYIDAFPRINNFFGEYGTVVHETLEQFFTGKLDIFELSDFYNKRFIADVVTPLPYGLGNLYPRYKKEGSDFFDSFNFNKEDYDVKVVEDMIELEIGDALFVAKPDLVLTEKSTGRNILYDYKTSMPWRTDKRSGKEIEDKKKIEGYNKQMYIYTYCLRTVRNMPISEIVIWFPRAKRNVIVPWIEEEENKAVEWLTETVKKIQSTNNFEANNSNQFFCHTLCSVKNYCKYKDLVKG